MRRVVVTGDALTWLAAPPAAAPLVTVMPDAAEVGMEVGEWETWFKRTAAQCFAASRGPTIFLQTDRKAGGRWISKPGLIAEVAAGPKLLWHRISLRRGPGKTDLHRPTYTHILCFGPGKPGSPAPDVLPPDKRAWEGGINYNAARMVMEYLKTQRTTTVLNPFSGHGTLLAAANELGLDAYGCEIDTGRAEIARHFSIPEELR